jgi:malate/lactate dehydrogenase
VSTETAWSFYHRLTYVGVEPLHRFMDEKNIAEAVEATRKAGAEIIRLKGWSAHHAPGAGVRPYGPGYYKG